VAVSTIYLAALAQLVNSQVHQPSSKTYLTYERIYEQKILHIIKF